MKSEDKEQYLKRGTLAVLGVLRDLEKQQTPVRVATDRGQFISRLLFVDQEQLIVDYGSNQYDNQLALEAHNLHLDAETHGAKVEFSLPELSAIEYEGLPAFAAPLPELLWMFQRREFFRVHAPLEPVFFCEVDQPDGAKLRFRLHDVSLGGIGVLAEDPVPTELNSGDMLKNFRVELGMYGRLEVDVQLLHIGERTGVNSKNETIATPRLSFRFVDITPVQERELQQAIFALERLARDKANRFQE